MIQPFQAVDDIANLTEPPALRPALLCRIVEVFPCITVLPECQRERQIFFQKAHFVRLHIKQPESALLPQRIQKAQDFFGISARHEPAVFAVSADTDRKEIILRMYGKLHDILPEIQRLKCMRGTGSRAPCAADPFHGFPVSRSNGLKYHSVIFFLIL